MTVKEASQRLGISVDTLKARIRRAGYVLDKDEIGRGIVTDEILQAVSTTQKDYSTTREDGGGANINDVLSGYTAQIEGLQRENKSLYDMVELLKGQLAIKDIQISDLSKALHQEQSLHLLTAKSEPETVEEAEKQKQEENEKPRRLAFWKRKE